MKRIFISLMILLGVSSYCDAQTIKFEYDASGNMVKRTADEPFEDIDVDGTYRLKVTPVPTKGPMNIRFFEGRSGNTVDCKIQVLIHPLTGTGAAPFNQTFDKGDININISNISSGYYVLVVLAYVDPKAPIQTTLKFEKQ